MPNVVLTVSTAAALTDSSVRAVYRLGLVVDQSSGWATFAVMVAVWVCPAGTLTVAAPAAAGFPAGPAMVTPACTAASAVPSLATSTWTWTVA